MMEMILFICLASEPNCTKETALQVIRVPLQQLAINCSFEAQSYAVHNAIDLEGMRMYARCRN